MSPTPNKYATIVWRDSCGLDKEDRVTKTVDIRKLWSLKINQGITTVLVFRSLKTLCEAFCDDREAGMLMVVCQSKSMSR